MTEQFLHKIVRKRLWLSKFLRIEEEATPLCTPCNRKGFIVSPAAGWNAFHPRGFHYLDCDYHWDPVAIASRVQ